MEEFKFKGRRIDNGEWVYGYFVKLTNYKKTSYWIFTGYAETDVDEWFPDRFEVIPETVTQEGKWV